ncbi:MAG: deoxycytidylate deaminase [Planctomycetes bacterium]|nr:deoxycytidylate deaminase [Planctomycetota bacterium]NOG55630.1 deoxycytidylate deaminase [Planctomycetota bacterium]
MTDTEQQQQRRPSWDEYYMTLVEQVSRRSPDPSTKHGCVLVDCENRVISTGYNGPVAGLPNDVVPLERPAKYDWMIHAEDNAVAFARCDLRGATAYVTGAPCSACFRRLLQVGVKRIVYGNRFSACISDSERDACRIMAEQLGVEVTIWETTPTSV